jgi:uncharacterized protein (TIGR03083 family)
MTISRDAFEAATRAFVAQVARIDTSALDGPGLGAWDLRALVGHASRSLVTVDTYLDRPAEQLDVPTAPEYYSAIAPLLAGDSTAAIEQRGREAGQALGDDPAAAIAQLAERVLAKVAAADPAQQIETIAGGMTLEEYLRTRTFELVVHGIDIDRALEREPAPDPLALADSLVLAAEAAAVAGKGVDLLLALTGRSVLPAGFSVV